MPATETTVLKPLADVATEAGATTLGEQLLGLSAWLASDMAATEQQLRQLEGLAQDPESAKAAAQHLIDSGGKRMRPMIVLLAARLGGESDPAAVRDLAVVAELIHAATLLHDDVIDEGDERRGQPAARRVYSNSASVLGGDHLLIEALLLVERSGDAGLRHSLLRTISEIITAEALQLQWRGRFVPDRDLYMRVIRGKTAVLFRWCFQAGAKLAGLSDADVRSLGAAGMALGEAFQLVDDVLDLDGDPTATGKALFTDLREGKLTWPLILAAEQHPDFTARVEACIGSDALDSRAAVVQTLRSCGALEATKALAEQRVEEALALLRSLPQSKAQQALVLLARRVVERKG